MGLQGRLVSAGDVSAGERDAMFALMERHYEGVRRCTFEADLDEKDWVVQVHHPRSGELCGFSTQMLLRADVGGRAVTALFSGDTIVAREHWGDSTLAREGGRLAMSLMEERGDEELYWFLISKGYKTYRFLPVFFRDFHPHPERPTTQATRAALDALAGGKFPGEYDAASGVVRAGPGHAPLRPGVADITPERLRDPFIRFFAERNPGHARGDELCCLAPLTRTNLTRAAYRVLGAETVPAGAVE